MDQGEPLSFAARVRQHRLNAGLTQEQLAERAGVSVRTISDLERGLYQAPHRDTVDRLSAALQLTQEEVDLLEATLPPRQRGPTPPAQQLPTGGAFPAPAPLPTGLVTFLALAIQDSARLWERAPDQMAQAIERYDRLSHVSVGENQGVLAPPRDVTADTRLAVFRTASDAAAAAVSIQRLAQEQPWPEDAALRIRMALHTGEAELRNGEYYGSAVGRCERLLGLAVGGHVLLSQVTSELIRAGLPSGATLRDLGEHHVADVFRPEHVFELVWPGASQDAPISSLSPLHAQTETVLRALIDGRVVIFAGETINLSGRPAGATWEQGSTQYLPTSSEMAGFLATSFDYPTEAPQELVRVAQFVSTMVGSGPLYDRMHTLLNAEYRPTPLHQFLAELPAALASRREAPVYPLIVTSSYDDALERAFLQAGQPFDVVSYVAEGESRGRFSHKSPEGRPRSIDKPNKYIGLSFDQRTIILKLHGTLDRNNAEFDSFAVTEDHFLDYLTGGDISTQVPVTVAARLRRGHFLFLGYSLRDWNKRVILRRLWGEQPLSYKSWAVHSTPADAMERGLWRDRGVDVLDVGLDDYLHGLRDRLRQVGRER